MIMICNPIMTVRRGGWAEDGVAADGTYEMDVFVHMTCARRT
jgi:hypothetical protein